MLIYATAIELLHGGVASPGAASRVLDIDGAHAHITIERHCIGRIGATYRCIAAKRTLQLDIGKRRLGCTGQSISRVVEGGLSYGFRVAQLTTFVGALAGIHDGLSERDAIARILLGMRLAIVLRCADSPAIG